MAVNVLQAAKEALEGLKTNEVIEIYADEFLFEDTSSKQQITDRVTLKIYFQRLFTMPQVSFSEIRILETDNFATIEWTWGGVSRTTGRPFQVRGVSVMELSDGKVVRESIYYDPKPALA